MFAILWVMSRGRRIKVADIAELARITSKSFAYGVQKGILIRVRGEWRAYVNACTHMGGQTDLVGETLVCRWHGATFDAATGEVKSGQAPAGTKLTSIPVIQEADGCYVEWELPPDPFA